LSTRLLAIVAYVFAILLCVRVAAADARTDARAHFKRGMDAISAARYEDGVRELSLAYEILPHPNVLYNIARAKALAGDLRGAATDYRRYLEGNPSDKEDVEQTLRALEAQLAPAADSPPLDADAGVSDASSTLVSDAASTALPAKARIQALDPAAAPHAEDVFEESVVTASQGKERPLDAPASTSIITEQDIRLSGLTRIPELVRRLAGIDIMSVTGSHSDVSIRGFNQRLANKVLVLVDGRSVYSDFLGATFWQSLSIGVEDIKQIEVVRGPGSALYGGVAFNGVINIITKTVADGKGGVRFGTGSYLQTHASAWTAGKEGKFSFRASGGFDYVPRWSREVADDRTDARLGLRDQNASARTYRVDLRGSSQLAQNAALTFGAGTALGSLETLGVGTLNSIVMPSFTASDVTAGLTWGVLETRVYYTRFDARTTLNAATPGQTLLPARADQNVFNGEALLRIPFVTGPVAHRFTLGSNYRYKNVDYTFLDSRRAENHGSLFVQEQAKIGERVSITGDYRLDYVPYLQSFVQSPRIALVLHPSKLSAVRASFATAFRPPTFLESYLNAPIQLPAAGGALQSQGFRQDDPDFRLKPERTMSAELGYRHHLAQNDEDFAVLEATGFFNRVSNLVQLADARALSLGDVAKGLGGLDAETGLFPVFFGGFENQCQVYNVVGAELGARVFPREGFDLYANYTLNVASQDFSGCAPERVVPPDQRTSVHKLNAGAQVRTKFGLVLSADVHLASSQKWLERVVSVQTQNVQSAELPVPAYTLLNAVVGYRFLRDHAEFSINLYNVLNVEHRQHPFGQLLGRRLMGFFSYTF
jgi:outer membrane receptor protein involved in Fe transport